MTEQIPDYNKYSIDDLNDILVHIDIEKYPDRVALVEEAIRKAPPKTQKEKAQQDKTSDFALWFGMEAIFWVVIALLALAGFSIF